MTVPDSCKCSFPWAGRCKSCADRVNRLAADPIMDVCSSECDKACSDNNHCNLVNDPHCPCYSCQQHNLDEYPEDKE